MFWPGDELEYLRPNVYRNVARQLNITVASESIVSDAFLAVAADIFSTGRFQIWSDCKSGHTCRNQLWCFPVRFMSEVQFRLDDREPFVPFREVLYFVVFGKEELEADTVKILEGLHCCPYAFFFLLNH